MLRVKLIAGVVLLVTTFLAARGHTSTVSEGIDWLETHQDPSGLWGADKQTPVRDAAVVVDVLQRAASDPDATADGITALGLINTSSTDFWARRIIALAGSGPVSSALTDDLLNAQNTDGGWGYQEGYGSNVLETALALHALRLALNSNPAAFASGISFLVSQQNGDGGWPFVAGEPSTVYYTAHAMLALQSLSDDYDVATPIQNGKNWLVTQAHGDGGFGTGTVSNPYETGLSLAAIAQVDTGAPAAINARNYLNTTQLPDGSWNADAYSTALALQGLMAQGNLQGRSLSLFPGMNLLGLPLNPLEPVTANGISTDNPNITQVTGWDRVGQTWRTGNFTIPLQDGFFARTAAPTSLGVLGRTLGENQCTTVRSGLNLISIPNDNSCYTAYSLIEDITGCREAHRWNPVLQRWTSVAVIGTDTTGDDFSIAPGAGYFVRVNAQSQWCTNACDTITVPVLPDLIVTAPYILINPNPAPAGAPVQIIVNIRNIGTDTAFNPRLDIYDGDPSAGGIPLAAGNLPVIVPPGGETGYFGNNFVFAAGPHEIYGIADRFNAIPELNELNNKDHRTLQVTAATEGRQDLVGGDAGSSTLASANILRPPTEAASLMMQPYANRDVRSITSTNPTGAAAVVIRNVEAGNHSSAAVTVNWVTSEIADGCVRYGTAFVDEFARCEGTFGGEVHVVELDNLDEGTAYVFEVVSNGVTDNNGGAYYQLVTTPAGAGIPSVLHGRVRRADLSNASGVVVFGTLRRGATGSHPLTAVTDADGRWILNLGNLKNSTTGQVLTYSGGDTIALFAQGGSDGAGGAQVLLSGNSPQDAGVITLTPCACDCHADPLCDTVIVDVLDVVSAAAVVFRNAPPLPDPNPLCPYERINVNCDQVTDVIDIVLLVDVAFRGFLATQKFCDPCAP